MEEGDVEGRGRVKRSSRKGAGEEVTKEGGRVKRSSRKGAG